MKLHIEHELLMFQIDKSIIICKKFVTSVGRFSILPMRARAEGNREWINQVNYSFAQPNHWMIASVEVIHPVTHGCLHRFHND